MKIPLAFLVVLNCLLSGLQAHDSEFYLQNRIAVSDKRYPSYILALNLMAERQVQMIVETGTSRDGARNFAGDGGSTIIFGNWAMQHGAFLYTVDLSPAAIQGAKEATATYSHHIEYVCSDSLQFLKNFDGAIDFLYLDSLDFNLNNPKVSQEHHLKEIMAALPHLHENSVVMIDDCDLPHGGKGALVIKFLVGLGWKIYFSGYQTILIR